VLLASDLLSSSDERQSTFHVTPEDLLSSLKSVPRVVILQASTELARGGPEPISSLLRVVAPAFIALGVDSVLVLPPLAPHLVSGFGSWSEGLRGVALPEWVAGLRGWLQRKADASAAHITLFTTH
jgi:hypothetical protein